jgi:hypothetical protein
VVLPRADLMDRRGRKATDPSISDPRHTRKRWTAYEKGQRKTVNTKEFAIAECPYCRETIYFPVTTWFAWETQYGSTEYDAELDTEAAFCYNGCELTEEDRARNGVEIYDFITTDVDHIGRPLR